MKAKKKEGKINNDIRENPETRVIVFNQLCQHVEAGFSIDCFPPLSDKTIFEFMQLYPNEFNHEQLEISIRKAKHGWENIGRKQSDGTCIGNSRSWFYNMAHRYGWTDKVQVDANVKGNVSVNVVNYGSSSDSQAT